MLFLLEPICLYLPFVENQVTILIFQCSLGAREFVKLLWNEN